MNRFIIIILIYTAISIGSVKADSLVSDYGFSRVDSGGALVFYPKTYVGSVVASLDALNSRLTVAFDNGELVIFRFHESDAIFYNPGTGATSLPLFQSVEPHLSTQNKQSIVELAAHLQTATPELRPCPNEPPPW